MATVGLIGGTGDLGNALAVHLAKKYTVFIGSRSPDKAQSAVNDVLADKSSSSGYLISNLKPAENAQIVSSCDFLVLTVPHANALDTVQSLLQNFRGNQVLISAVAAVGKQGDEFFVDEVPGGGSFAECIRKILPETIKVAAAFQTVPANVMYKGVPISADVPVAADSPDTFSSVASLISSIDGLRPLHVGSLKQAGEVERLTALLLNLGKRNALKSPTTKFPSF